MSITQARVVSIEARSIRVSVAEQSACGGCRSKSACGVGTIREIPVKEQIIKQLKIDDQVELTLPTAVTLGLACLLYLPPVFGFLLGMASGAYYYGSDALTLTGGVSGLIAGFLLTWGITKTTKTAGTIEVLLMK